MLWKGLSQWWNRISAKAILQRFDKRRQQNEIDTHKLFLLTSYWQQRKTGAQIGEGFADDLAKEAERHGFEGQQRAVNANMLLQISNISTILEEELIRRGESPLWRPAEPFASNQPHDRKGVGIAGMSVPRKGLGLAMAVGCSRPADASGPGTTRNDETGGTQDSTPQKLEISASTGRATMKELSDALKESLHYVVKVKPSSVPHRDSGDGLWVVGNAPLGSVVALYPGVVYRPIHYRHMLNYPRVDKGNPYLFARFDGAILDAKSWGHGRESLREDFPLSSRIDAEKELGMLEARHPLALAHFANHPGEGMSPNVMAAPVNVNLTSSDSPIDRHFRAFLPNVVYQSDEYDRWDVDDILGVVLVALRDICDEEVLLNYRLTPHVLRPDWYVAVDQEEEWRRWA